MANPFKVVIHAEAEAWEVGESEGQPLIEWAGGWIIRHPLKPKGLQLLRSADAPMDIHPKDVLMKDPRNGEISRHTFIGAGGASAKLYWQRADAAPQPAA